jgi:hypothetical protein
MSMFSWIFTAKKPTLHPPASSGLSRVDPTRPVRRDGRDSAPVNNAQPANRKAERMARRELLYAIVRAAMLHAGVLSASYKFKVLSLDGRGRQFLVMIDLARNCAMEPPQLSEIEAMVAQGAKARHDILVSAVYWRMSEYVAVGEPRERSSTTATVVPKPDATPAPLDAQPPAAAAAARSQFEPIQADEVAAFKQALAVGAINPAAAAAAAVGVQHGVNAVAFDGSSKHGPQSYTLLTGFEDTEMGEDHRAVPVLSGTQYGDLN